MSSLLQGAQMTLGAASHKLSWHGTTAVHPEYYCGSLDTCPRRVSVWLLTR